MNSKKILVVDDSLTSLMWQRMVLDQARYDVVVARDGHEGIALAMSEHPDLILLDVDMPAMDGVEAYHALRADTATRATPVIMVTTPSGQRRLEAQAPHGYDDRISKPIDRKELIAKVKNLIGD